MKLGMRQSLVRCLVTVVVAGGALLLLDSAATASTPSVSPSGDQPALCADDWTSLDDPEVPLPRQPFTLPEMGGHNPFVPARVTSTATVSFLPFAARAPPVR